MGTIPVYGGKPWSPHFVFIRNINLSDRDVLALLNLRNYVSVPSIEEWNKYLGISRDTQWTHLADNWFYSHWHSEQFRSAVSVIATRFDVFSFAMGDSDNSFDLFYYRNGVLVRRVIWDDPHYTGGHLREEMGAPLPMEDEINRGGDPCAGLWKVASALNVETDYTQLSFSLYAPPYRQAAIGEPVLDNFEALC